MSNRDLQIQDIEYPRWQSWLAFAFALAVALWAARGYFTTYGVYGHSAKLDVVRVVEYAEAVRNWDLYPRWAAHTYYGFGSPLFHFYSPGAYVAAGVAHACGLPIWAAVKLPFFSAWLLACCGMFLLGRRIAGPWAGLAAAAGLVFAPYFLVDAYVRAAGAEMWGIALAPWGIWAVLGVAEQGGRLRTAVLALIVALIVLSHNISAMVMLPVLILTVILLCGDKAKEGFLALGLGLLMSIFFWLPALAEKGLVWAAENLTQGHFFYGNHFLSLGHIAAPQWSRWPPNTVSPGSFEIGLAHLGLLFLAPLCLAAVRSRDVLMWLLYLVALGSLLMVTQASEVLWQSLPLLPYVQFPWRFLGFFAWAVSALVAWPVLWAAGVWGRRGAAAFGIGWVALVIFTYSVHIAPTYLSIDPQDGGEIEALTLDQHRINLDLGYPDVVDFWTVENMQWFKARGTSWDDFLPRVVSPAACLFCEDYIVPAKIIQGRGEITEAHRAGSDIDVLVEAASQITMALHAFAFPGWSVTLDGESVSHAPRESIGDITLTVPRGEHRIEARYRGTALARISDLVSLLAWLAFAAMLISHFVRRGRDTAADRD